MLSPFQKTIVEKISFKGVGLHSGLKTGISIYPAGENSGIVFKRIDLDKNNIIKANFENVSCAKLCTTLQNKFNVTVSTVEHLLIILKFLLWMALLKNLSKLLTQLALKI